MGELPIYRLLLLGLFLRLRRGRFLTGRNFLLANFGFAIPVMTTTVRHHRSIPYAHGSASSVMHLRYRNVNAVDVFYAMHHSPVQGNPPGKMEMVHPVLTSFASKLKALRMKKGVSQEKLAEMAGLHRTYVSLVERGTCNISLLNIHKLAEALGVPLTKLMP